MKITTIEISVFELPLHMETFKIIGIDTLTGGRWLFQPAANGAIPVQVMRVKTDEGIDGVCTVGDWRYSKMRSEHFSQLKEVVVGEDPLAREHLYAKLNFATRFMFTEPGWFGGFDNCLWDIAGKAAGLPVAQLLGGAKERCRAYYNINGETSTELLQDAEKVLDEGYEVLKDHLFYASKKNMALFRELRKTLGVDVGLLHDAALAGYTFEEAVQVGCVLQELDFLWFEEPLPDRRQGDYIRLSERLDIPIAGPETFMHDPHLSALWLKSGAVKLLRVNARHGTTPVLKLAHFAELQHRFVEPNTLGPLFGLVHAHLACGINNIRLFEVFPPPPFGRLAEEIGLLNPVEPNKGWVSYPAEEPGWGARWDWNHFEKKRIAVL